MTDTKLTFNSSSDANLSSEAVKTRAIPSLEKRTNISLSSFHNENKRL